MPTELPFTVLDVFTETRYEGNPLAVVRLPDTATFSPTQLQLQAIASEFNLSETIFLEHITEEDKAASRCRARIFTTAREILFAGHPTIGAATYLLTGDDGTKGLQTLVPGAGPIPISLDADKPGYVNAIIPQIYHQHAKPCPAYRLWAMHTSLSGFVDQNAKYPIVSIVHGMTFILVELKDLEALATAGLANSAALIRANDGLLDAGWEYDAPVVVYFYVRDIEDTAQGGIEVIRTRMMVKDIEDPATGSAASTLAGYLALSEAKERGSERQWKIVQGVEMGRRSEIGVKVGLDGDKIGSIELNGTAVAVSEGTIIA